MSLELKNVTKKFGEFTAVDDLSLSIRSGEIFGFLGANGAGKTTSFRMILGLLDPTAGKVRWNGERIDYSKSAQIGYLPEERGLLPKLKVQEQLIYLASLRGMSKADAVLELEKWLTFFNVPDYMNVKVGDLSKGNQQKIQFIAAVIHKPKLVILDEPFSGLDPVNADLLKDAIHQIKQPGTAILFSSHQMSHVEELCENLCILQKGKPIVYGALKEIKRSYGKKNLLIKADFDLTFLADHPQVLKYRATTEGMQLQIADERAAKQIQQDVMSHGFVRQFALEEPSLHDIFIEKVGGKYE